MANLAHPLSHLSLHIARIASLLAVSSMAACGGGGGAAGAEPVVDSSEQTQGKESRSPTPVATPARASSAVLRASAALYQGVGAAVTVRYNGVPLSSVTVRTLEAQDYNIEIPKTIDGGILDVVFSNATDAEGKQVRHLKIESIKVVNASFLPTDSRLSFDRGDGAKAFDGQDLQPGQTTLLSNGALRLLVPSAQRLHTLGTLAATAAEPGYYVDAETGEDANSGTIDRPWRTLSRLASVKLNTGEGIYLRCGRIWREALALSAKQLVDGNTVAGYGAECSDRKAVISGADNFNGGWQRGGNVWSRSLPAGTPKITQLFIDGQPLTTARWPNAPVDGGIATALAGATSRAQLVLAAADTVALGTHDMVGATAQLRTEAWRIETRSITASRSGTLELSRQLEGTLDSGEGFVLQDKLWMLDAPGEFLHDTAAQRLYVIAPSSGAPADFNAALVEGSVRDVALLLTKRTNLSLRNLSLRAAREDGLRMVDAPQAQLTQIEASNNAFSGINLQQFDPVPAGLSGPSVTDSVAAGNGQYGINAEWVSNAVISRSRALGTGTAAHHQAGVIAGISAGPGGRIQDSTVDGAGYLGIGFSTQGGSVVARNTVIGYCRRLSDCGGIYTWTGRALAGVQQSATVEGNRVLAATAQTKGALWVGRESAVGIYLDDFSRGVVVRNNLLAGMPVGVFLHNASDITVESNRIWLPTVAALWASMDQHDADWMRGNVFRNNQIVPLVQAQVDGGAPGLPAFVTSHAVWFWHATGGEAALAAGRNVFSGNSVVQLQGWLAEHALLHGPTGQRTVDAAGWQALNSGEGRPLHPARYATVLATLGTEQLQNGSFDAGLGPWLHYRSPAGTGGAAAAVAGPAGCTGPCISLTSGHRSDLLASAPLSLRAGSVYLYRWTAATTGGSAAVVGEPYISRSGPPYDQMSDARGFVSHGTRSIGVDEPLSFEAFFVAKGADPARLNLQLDTLGVPVNFDSVSVREVTGYTVAQAAAWAAVAFTTTDANAAVDCTELGWPAGCKAIGLDGQPLTLPLALAAGTERLLLRADSPLRR